MSDCSYTGIVGSRVVDSGIWLSAASDCERNALGLPGNIGFLPQSREGVGEGSATAKRAAIGRPSLKSIMAIL